SRLKSTTCLCCPREATRCFQQYAHTKDVKLRGNRTRIDLRVHAMKVTSPPMARASVVQQDVVWTHCPRAFRTENFRSNTFRRHENLVFNLEILSKLDADNRRHRCDLTSGPTPHRPLTGFLLRSFRRPRLHHR